MRLPIKTLLRLGRATILATAIVAASGLLEITGRPLLAAVGNVTLNLAAVRSEAEKLRRIITGAARLTADRSKRPEQVAIKAEYLLESRLFDKIRQSGHSNPTHLASRDPRCVAANEVTEGPVDAPPRPRLEPSSRLRYCGVVLFPPGQAQPDL